MSQPDTDLVSRLRGWQGEMPDALKQDLAKAADTIEHLSTEREQLLHDLARVMERENRFLNALVEARNGLYLNMANKTAPVIALINTALEARTLTNGEDNER